MSKKHFVRVFLTKIKKEFFEYKDTPTINLCYHDIEKLPKLMKERINDNKILWKILRLMFSNKNMSKKGIQNSCKEQIYFIKKLEIADEVFIK